MPNNSFSSILSHMNNAILSCCLLIAGLNIFALWNSKLKEPAVVQKVTCKQDCLLQLSRVVYFIDALKFDDLNPERHLKEELSWVAPELRRLNITEFDERVLELGIQAEQIRMSEVRLKLTKLARNSLRLAQVAEVEKLPRLKELFDSSGQQILAFGVLPNTEKVRFLEKINLDFEAAISRLVLIQKPKSQEFISELELMLKDLKGLQSTFNTIETIRTARTGLVRDLKSRLLILSDRSAPISEKPQDPFAQVVPIASIVLSIALLYLAGRKESST